ncbi:MAG TPA: hypothetical protein VGQ63_13600 [Pseudolabrys sp.]|jgi:uncharacterized protein (TIGR02594 family)|nr:hypothetical protein [Pseudolabrys sp.]
MANEQEELRLVVNLTDNASAGIAKLRGELGQLGSGSSGQNLDKFKRETTAITQVVKGLGTEMGLSARVMTSVLVPGIGTAVTAIGALGALYIEQIRQLPEWTAQLRAMGDAAKNIGANAGQYRSIVEQLGALGVSAEAAQNSMAGINNAIADLTRRGSALRQSLLQHAGPEGAAGMRAWIDSLLSTRTEAERTNKVIIAGENVYKNALKETNSEIEARRREQDWLRQFGVDPALAGKRVKELSAEEQAAADARNKNGKEFADLLGTIGKQFGEIGDMLKDPLIGPDSMLVKGMHLASDVLDKIIEGLKWISAHQAEVNKPLEDEGILDRLRRRALPPSVGGGVDRPAAEKMSYSPVGGPYGGLLQNASFTTGGPAGGPAYGPGRGGPMGYGGVSGGAGYGSHDGGSHGYGGPTPSGSDTGGSDASVPSDILARAKQVALTGGPGAVEQFMAQQGYPKRGAWCGEFAASVVKSVGGTPPKDPAIASNWRNWGTAVEGAPQPGDIAVRRGARTGSTGSHVTVVESVDPKTGRFIGVGGNQGRPESSYRTGGYEFRRATGAMPNGQTAGPGSGKGAGDTPATSHGADGAGGAGVPEIGAGLMGAIEKIESGGNPRAVTGQYKGLFQLSEGEFRRYGGKGSIFDPEENRRIAALKIKDEAAKLSSKLGRPVSEAEVYLAHQQGVGGATEHLTHPDRAAWESMYATGEGQEKGAGWAKKAIWGNIPDAQKRRFGSVENVTSGDFAQLWRDRYARARGYGSDAEMTASRQQIDRSQQAAKVEGTGKITVDVNAPKGTNVGAEGGGLFKNVEVNRQTQMEQARSGPVAETLSL